MTETENAWTSKTPTEGGYYWLYQKEGQEWRLQTVEVWVIREGQPNQEYAYVSEGTFLYPESPGFQGFWQKIERPKLPPTKEDING